MCGNKWRGRKGVGEEERREHEWGELKKMRGEHWEEGRRGGREEGGKKGGEADMITAR